MSYASQLPPEDRPWVEKLVVEYVLREKKWDRDDFRIEHNGLSSDEKFAIVSAIHLDDERNPVPGAGKSMELHIDRADRKIVKELGFQ